MISSKSSLLCSFFFILTVFPAIAGCSVITTDTETQNRLYLESIYQRTFNFIQDFSNPETGIPYDSNRIDKKATSITNIGFYMASIAVAGKTGLIEPGLALKQIQKTLRSLEKAPRWLGFPVTWIDAETLGQTNGTSFSYADHLGNLIASLMVVKQLYPETSTQIDHTLRGFHLKPFYDPANHWLRGGYDTKKKAFTIKQPWGNWYYNLGASDTRFLSLYGIATGEFPKEHWTALNWKNEEKYGLTYFEPGWQGGGLFMQYISGIFLDEKNTPIGKSAKNFAAAQIKHAEANNLSVWGWSACEAPWGEYRGWGKITDHVVTPHASILAIEDFPNEVIANLKKLDQMGLSEAWNGKQYGYRDSIDLTSKKTASAYLMLDQTMIFLSLANFLYDEIVRRSCMLDKTIRRGFKTIYADDSKT